MNFITQIIVQLIIAAATIFAAHVTIKGTVKQELIRLHFSKAEKLSDDFSKMCVEVELSLSAQNKKRAQGAVAALRGQFSGELSTTIDELPDSLNVNNPHRTKALLDKAVMEYRELVFGNTNSKTSIFRRFSK